MNAVEVLRRVFREIQSGEVLSRNGNDAWDGEHRICKLIGLEIWVGFGVNNHGGVSNLLELTLFASKDEAEANREHLIRAYCDEADQNAKILLDFPFNGDEIPFGPRPLAIALLINELEKQGAGTIPKN